MPDSSEVSFTEITRSPDTDKVAVFLAGNRWPFHGRANLTLEEARRVKLGPRDQARAFWIRYGDLPVGVLRVFDLEDVDRGSVQFDLRISEPVRGSGIGSATVAWMIEMLFSEYPKLHRIEAATRFDNVAMRRVLERNQFVLEGHLREAWPMEDGTRHDTALYGRLRIDSRPPDSPT